MGDSDGLPSNESWIMSAWQKKDYRRHGTYAGRRKYPCAFEQPERTCDDLEYVELHFCGNEIISSSTGKVGELPENIYDLLQQNETSIEYEIEHVEGPSLNIIITQKRKLQNEEIRSLCRK